MLVNQLGTGLPAKRGLGVKGNFHAKRSSLNSKENKKGLSHFNLNGIISLGGNGLYGYRQRGLKQQKALKRNNKSGTNYNFSVLKKNLSSKQKVLYSSLNQAGGRGPYHRSQKILRKSSTKNFSPMIMGNLKKRHSDKNILSHKFVRGSSKGSLVTLSKGRDSSDIENRKSKGMHSGLKKKGFGRKSNSLKVFHKEPKKSSRTLKNVLSDKNLNSKKTRQTAGSRKEKKKTVVKMSNLSTKAKNRRSSENVNCNVNGNKENRKTETKSIYPRFNLIKDGGLDGFVTKVSESKPTPSLVSSNFTKDSKFGGKKLNAYYMQGLFKAFMKKGNDYFSNLYRIHFNQSLQFLNVKKGLSLNGYVPNGKLAFIPGGKKYFFSF